MALIHSKVIVPVILVFSKGIVEQIAGAPIRSFV
jgi:hypothetical protein